MPCYDYSRDDNLRKVEVTKPSESQLRDLNDKDEKIQYLEACLCALIKELEKRNIADEIIPQASKSGLVDIMTFWGLHSEEDKTRLSLILHQFSEHEQSVIKEILNKTSK